MVEFIYYRFLNFIATRFRVEIGIKTSKASLRDLKWYFRISLLNSCQEIESSSLRSRLKAQRNIRIHPTSKANIIDELDQCVVKEPSVLYHSDKYLPIVSVH